MKQKDFRVLLMAVLIFSPNNESIAGEGSPYLLELNSLAKECFSTRDAAICEKALIVSESFQRYADSKENYACQSRLLGLGADLIMTPLNSSKIEPAFPILEGVNLFCRNF